MFALRLWRWRNRKVSGLSGINQQRWPTALRLLASHSLIPVLAGKFTIALLRFVLTSLATLSCNKISMREGAAGADSSGG